jgi:hypothetical protein
VRVFRWSSRWRNIQRWPLVRLLQTGYLARFTPRLLSCPLLL